jgi:hypothetical protein
MATDGTQYLIELAAKFTGGDAAVSTLETMGDRMLAAGAASGNLESAAKSTAVALEQSAAAVKSANDALTQSEAKYAAAEAAANKASRSVEQIAQQMARVEEQQARALAAGNTKRLEDLDIAYAQLYARQKEAGASAEKLAGALSLEAAELDLVKIHTDAVNASHKGLEKGYANLGEAAKKASAAEKEAAAKAAAAGKAAAGTGKLSDIGQALSKVGGPIGEVSGKLGGLAGAFTKLGGAMGSAGPYVAVAVAIVAIGAAAVAAAVSITTWGVSLADANRTQGLLIDGLAGSAAAGGDLADAIDNVSSAVPMTRSELMDLAGDLKKSGVAGDQLAGKLEEAAIKAAKLKFGPDFAAEMLSLNFQSKRFGENIKSTFGGLKIDKLLEGIAKLGSLFDSATESGGAMQFLFESLFQPLVDGSADALVWVERLFLYAELYAVKAYTATLPFHGIFKMIGQAILIASAIIIGVFVAAIAAVVVNVALVLAYFGALAYAIYKVWSFCMDLTFAIWKMIAALTGLDVLYDVGKNIVLGLVEGVWGAAKDFAAAILGVIKNGVGGVMKFLKMGSPSKLFAEMGSDTVAGYTMGVDDSAGEAESAMQAMVAPPMGAAPGKASPGGASVVVQNMTINGESAKELALDFIEQLTRALEGDALSLGGGEVAHA